MIKTGFPCENVGTGNTCFHYKNQVCTVNFLFFFSHKISILIMVWIKFKSNILPRNRFSALIYVQKYSRLRCLLCVKGLVICFYLGLSGSTLLITKHIIRLVQRNSYLLAAVIIFEPTYTLSHMFTQFCLFMM